MTCGIYLIYTTTPNSKKYVKEFYIGKSKNVEQRVEQHIALLSSGEHTKKMRHVVDFEYLVLRRCHQDYLDPLERDYYRAAILAVTGEPIFDLTDTSIHDSSTLCLNTQKLAELSIPVCAHTAAIRSRKNLSLKGFLSSINVHLRSAGLNVSDPLF